MTKENIDNQPGLFALVREEQYSIQSKLKVIHESFEGLVGLVTKLESNIKNFDTRVTFLELAAKHPSTPKRGLLSKEPDNGNGDSKVLP